MKSPDSRLLAVAACLLWATAFLGVKEGLAYLPPLLFAGIRFTGAGIAVLLISRRKGVLRQIQEHWKLIILTGFLQTFLLYSLFFVSLTLMRASTGAIVNGLGPLIVAAAGHFFLPGNKLERRRFLCLLLGVGGVILVGLNGKAEAAGGSPSEIGGILLMFAALLASATASVVVSKSSREADPFILNGVQLIAGGLMLLTVSLLKGDQAYQEIRGASFWLALAWLMTVTGGGFSIWYYLLKVRRIPLSEIAVWKFLIPLGGAIISWTFIKTDTPSINAVSGMVLTALSIVLFYRLPASKPAGRDCLAGEAD